MEMNRVAIARQGYRLLAVLLLGVFLWLGWPPVAQASTHVYRERPGQITYRSRQSLRDYEDRAWQAIAFKRYQGNQLQGLYLRLVGFPGTVVVDAQRPIVFTTATAQQWQLPWDVDPQTQSLPESVGQYNLQPLLADLKQALPLEMQIPLANNTAVEVGIAPFIVREWLQISTATLSSLQSEPGIAE